MSFFVVHRVVVCTGNGAKSLCIWIWKLLEEWSKSLWFHYHLGYRWVHSSFLWHACRLTLILRSTMFQCLLKEVLNHYSCIATNFSNKRDTNKMLIVIIRTDECWLCLWNGNRTEAGYVGVVTCKWISTVPEDSMILFLVGRLKMNPIM